LFYNIEGSEEEKGRGRDGEKEKIRKII